MITPNSTDFEIPERVERARTPKGFSLHFKSPSIDSSLPNTPPLGPTGWLESGKLLDQSMDLRVRLLSVQQKMAIRARNENDKIFRELGISPETEIGPMSPPLEHRRSPSYSGTPSPITLENRRRSILSDDSNITCNEDSWDEIESLDSKDIRNFDTDSIFRTSVVQGLNIKIVNENPTLLEVTSHLLKDLYLLSRLLMKSSTFWLISSAIVVLAWAANELFI